MSNIMLVDDDRTNVRLMKMLLEMDGFNVTICRDVTAAKAAATSQIEAFVVDYHLSNNEVGLDLLHAIRKAETQAHQNTPIIMTTGDHRQGPAALKAGANTFMLKPFAPSELAETLSQILHKHQS